MSTKSGIYHSGEYVDGKPHFYLYFDYADCRLHLQYRDEQGLYTDMILPEESPWSELAISAGITLHAR